MGIDLGDDFCRISYGCPGEETRTVSCVTGAEQYSIPTILCRREGIGQWFFGREAVRFAHENGGILIDHLLSKAVSGEMLIIEGRALTPISLLTLFLKRCITLLGQNSGNAPIAAVLFTTANPDYRHLEVLREAVSGLHLETDDVFFQSYTESFYHYMTSQSGDLWYKGSLLLEHRGDTIRSLGLEANLRTAPTVVYIHESEIEFSCVPRSNHPSREQELVQLDRKFANICQSIFDNYSYRSVYLIGDQFSDEWMRESIKYLCSKTRVFRGNNLYSKGAVYGCIARALPGSEPAKSIFLGNDKLTCNIGMRILSQGDNKYFALLDAGVNWFDASRTFDFYLQGGNCFDIKISSLVGGENRIARITLDDYDEKLCRFRAHLYLSAPNTLVVRIEELGLGAIRGCTHHVWQEEIDLTI